MEPFYFFDLWNLIPPFAFSFEMFRFRNGLLLVVAKRVLKLSTTWSFLHRTFLWNWLIVLGRKLATAYLTFNFPSSFIAILTYNEAFASKLGIWDKIAGLCCMADLTRLWPTLTAITTSIREAHLVLVTPSDCKSACPDSLRGFPESKCLASCKYPCL